MTDEAEQLVEDVASFIEAIPSTSDLDDDEEYELRMSLFCGRRGKRKGVATQAVFGTGPKVAEWVHENVEPLIDMRKAKQNQSINIGTVTIMGTGEVVDFDVDEKYLKPSEVEQ